MSLNRDERETPTQAFVRKTSSKGETVIDEQTGEGIMWRERGEGTTF